MPVKSAKSARSTLLPLLVCSAALHAAPGAAADAPWATALAGLQPGMGCRQVLSAERFDAIEGLGAEWRGPVPGASAAQRRAAFDTLCAAGAAPRALSVRFEHPDWLRTNAAAVGLHRVELHLGADGRLWKVRHEYRQAPGTADTPSLQALLEAASRQFGPPSLLAGSLSSLPQGRPAPAGAGPETQPLEGRGFEAYWARELQGQPLLRIDYEQLDAEMTPSWLRCGFVAPGVVAVTGCRDDTDAAAALQPAHKDLFQQRLDMLDRAGPALTLEAWRAAVRGQAQEIGPLQVVTTLYDRDAERAQRRRAREHGDAVWRRVNGAGGGAGPEGAQPAPSSPR